MAKLAILVLLLVQISVAEAALKIKSRIKANVPNTQIIKINGVNSETPDDKIAELISLDIKAQSGYEVVAAHVVKSSVDDSIKLLAKNQAQYSALSGKNLRKIENFGKINKSRVYIVHLRNLSMNGGGLALYHVYLNERRDLALSVEQFLYSE